MIPQLFWGFSTLMEKRRIALAADICSHIWIHTYLWLECSVWRAREICYEWQNQILYLFLPAAKGICDAKDTGWSRLVYLGFSISFKACSYSCCNDMGECWFLLNILQICTACSVPGKMPLWRDITAELPENSSVMGRGRRKEGRHKEQNVPTATHQDTGVRYESAAAKEALMPRGDYVRTWDKWCHWHLWVFLRHLTVSLNLRRETCSLP